MLSKIRFLQMAVLALLLLQGATLLFFYLKPPPQRLDVSLKNRIIKLLFLDEEQIQSYESLIESHQAGIRALETDILTARQNLYRGLKQDEFAQKDTLVNRIGLLLGEVERTHFEHFIALKKVCRPEQVREFDAVIEAMEPIFFKKEKRRKHPKHE